MSIKDSDDDLIRIPDGPDRGPRVRRRGWAMKVALSRVVVVVVAALAILLAYVAIAMSWASYRR
ncbi:hypothetical protein FXW78_48745 [Rhodococcus opacus]|nr:hypothetical protein [Rhodococcus opacus]